MPRIRSLSLLQAGLLLSGRAPETPFPVDRARLMSDLGTLAAPAMEGRAPGSAGSRRAQAFLRRRFRDLGLLPFGSGFGQSFPRGKGRPGLNLLGYLEGRGHPDRAIVLSAHYDHLGMQGGRLHPGADDNASGVAALLALGAYFKAHPPVHTVILAAFDAEEEGLLGAKAFLASPPLPKERIRLNVNLDMVGRNAKGELYVAGTSVWPALRPVLEEAARHGAVTLRLGHDRGRGHENWTCESDQGPFHDAGIPWLYFGVEDHEDYHRPTDTVDRIEAGFFLRAVRTVLEAVVRLDASELPAPRP